MSVERIFIVGDKFAQFAENAHVMAASKLEAILDGDLLHQHNLRFQLGQGVSEELVARLLEKAASLKKPWLTDFSKPLKAGRQHAHKHQQHNSMISMPRRLSHDSFEVDVLLDDRCAEMSDHMTGQHIQGMVLTEAARQTFLAVSEEFYLHNEPHSSYFVINNMDVEYLRFVFPLPMTILYQVLDHKISERSRSQRFEVRMSVIQAQQICCVVKTKFSTYPDALIAEKEAGLAKQAILSELNPEIVHEKSA
ncbi:AfsA-related hotdog domain-containing protein [Pseudomonas anguilliseptica]|uniref:AfsA-related hotdog domain-containing protein n=1 Tax=Pseudomonas anguilliseptica TaxID=53406 RepID=UPI0022AEC547|nr:AfsA-related hotdog domain-containing protein [Pseudomonas anguilliseptica]MCZ4324355.1 AfsA-related hotdog domain-containing protein [Pseudomonas anguilliseptica]